MCHVSLYIVWEYIDRDIRLGQYIIIVSKILLLASIKQNYFIRQFSAHQHDVT